MSEPQEMSETKSQLTGQTIPVIVVGGGMSANKFHLPAWTNIKQTEVVAICDVDRNRATETAKSWNVPQIYDNLDDALEREDKAIVDVITPPGTHASLSVRAMELGHHVVLEKPMAMTTQETERIWQEYLKRKGELKFCVVQNLFFSPHMQRIRTILSQRKVEILSIDVKMLHTPADPMFSDRDHWVHSLPGGRFGENLIHPVYMLRNLMGTELNVRDVFATKRGSYSWVQNDELYVTFDAQQKFGSIQISFNSSRRTLPFSLYIYGKNAILSLDGANLTYIVQGPLTEAYLPDSKLARGRILRDAVSSSTDILSCTASNVVNVLSRRRISGHEALFKHLVSSIIDGTEMPYPPQESYEANRTFIQVLSRLTNSIL